jgi:hypothetical protein
VGLKVNRSFRSRRVLLAVSATAALVLLWVAPSAFAWPSASVTSPHPISVAYNGNDMLMTGGDEANTECTNDVTAWDTNGQPRLFAKLRNRPGCLGSELETYMYTVPQYEPYWPVGTTFAVHGAHIYAIDQSGNWYNFANGPCKDTDIPGITIDTGGNWGHLMFVTCSHSGTVYTVDNAGVARPFADLSQPPVSAHWVEGPAIAPRSFSQPSRLIIPDETTNNIYAFSPWDNTRSVSIMATFQGVEDIDFIPQNLCTYGQTGGAFFSSVPSSTGGEIDKRPPSDFAGYSNAAVLTSEYGQGLGILTGPGSVVPFQYGFDHNRTYEGSTFLTYKAGCGAVTDPHFATSTGLPLATTAASSKLAASTTSRKVGVGQRGVAPLPLYVQARRRQIREAPPRHLRLIGVSQRAKRCARSYVRFSGSRCHHKGG